MMVNFVWHLLNFSTEGLVLHLDAGTIFGAESGMVVNNWMDLSPNANHANVVNGEPTYTAEGINGLPAVHFNGTK